MKDSRIMPEVFLNLPLKDQATILNIQAPAAGKSPLIAEKDIWVCWTLQQLFSMPNRPPMAFKGGTALSKVYGVIERFSEDIDITLDYRGFAREISDNISRSALAKLSEELKEFVAQHSKTVVKPYFEAALSSQFPDSSFVVEVSDNGEKVRIHYPSAFADSGNQYLSSNVLIEFGGRNITEPNEPHAVAPYVDGVVPDLEFPIAEVTVLALPRSFWEKVTLIHVECHREEFRANADRISRHWYDLACLALHDKGKQSMLDRDLLFDVVKYKKYFYNSSYANYDACLKWQFRLVPEKRLLEVLNKDFEQMLRSGMFYGKPPVFADVIKTVGELEQLLNRQSI